MHVLVYLVPLQLCNQINALIKTQSGPGHMERETRIRDITLLYHSTHERLSKYTRTLIYKLLIKELILSYFFQIRILRVHVSYLDADG